MLRNHFAFHHHIIYINLDIFPQLQLEHLCHHSLINGSCVLQPEWHYFVMVIPNRGNKSGFFLVVQGQRNLMITLEDIQETHLRMADSSIYQLVYLGHRKWILGTSLIYVREINAHSPLPTLFLHHHSICKPFRIENFFDSPNLLKSSHFLLDCFGMLFGWAPRGLLLGGD